MLKCIKIGAAVRDKVRAMSFLKRTGLTLILSFVGLQAFSIAADMLWRFMANHGMLLAGIALVGGQALLYQKDLGRLKAVLSKAMKGQEPTRPAQQPSAGKAAAPVQASQFVLPDIGEAFAEDDEDLEEEEALLHQEQFEDE